MTAGETSGGEQAADQAAIRGVLRAYHDAMVAARTDALDGLLDPAYTLVHISGYVQPRAEWFGVIEAGTFAYHRITVDERLLAVIVTGDTAVATGRGVFDATIHGTRRPWRLAFTIELAKRGDRRGTRWIISHARYTSS